MRKVAWTTCLGGGGGGGEKKYNLAREGSETRAEEDERGKKEGRKLLNLFIGDRAVEREKERVFLLLAPHRPVGSPPLFSGPLRENPGTDRRRKRKRKEVGFARFFFFLSPPFSSFDPILLFCRYVY